MTTTTEAKTPAETGQFQVPAHVQHNLQDGKAVILQMRSGRYLGLDEVGTRMWTLLADGKSSQAVAGRLAEEYNVEEERVRQDLAAFIGRCCERGILERAA